MDIFITDIRENAITVRASAIGKEMVGDMYAVVTPNQTLFGAPFSKFKALGIGKHSLDQLEDHNVKKRSNT